MLQRETRKYSRASEMSGTTRDDRVETTRTPREASKIQFTIRYGIQGCSTLYVKLDEAGRFGCGGDFVESAVAVVR